MAEEPFPEHRLERILTAVETIETSLGILGGRQELSREQYRTEMETQDVVERRFVKMTEAALDIAEELERYRTFVRAVYEHLDAIGALDESE